MYEVKDKHKRLELEPLLIKGALVDYAWWQPAEEIEAKLSLRLSWRKWAVLAMPVIAIAVYLFLIASDQYVSVASFTVHSGSGGGSVGGLAALAGGPGVSHASEETGAVVEYLLSRNLVDALVKEAHLRDILSNSSIDIFHRYPVPWRRNTNEGLFEHFQNLIDVSVDGDTGIATLTVRAFTADDAHDLANAMLDKAEALINELNARIYKDNLRLATRQVEEGKAGFADVQERLTRFRNEAKLVDPEKELAAALTAVSEQMSELMSAEASLNSEIALTPNSPKLQPLKERINSLRDEIAKQRAVIVGGDTTMVAKLGDFDRLMLDRELAARGLGSAVDHLTSARQDAEKQQYYLQRIVHPEKADEPKYPKRKLDFVLTTFFYICILVVCKTLGDNIREHTI